MAGLVLASIFVYRYYFIPHVRPDYSLQCALVGLAMKHCTKKWGGGEMSFFLKTINNCNVAAVVFLGCCVALKADLCACV